MEVLDITSDPVHVLALVLDSINEKASIIFIKLDNKRKHIQITDNGIGLSLVNFPDLQNNHLYKYKDLKNCINMRHYICSDFKEKKITYKLQNINDLLECIKVFITNLFAKEKFIKEIFEYSKLYPIIPIKTDNTCAKYQVKNNLPLSFYEKDHLKNINKNKKSILFNSNIKHNPLTIFFTKYGIFPYESIKQRNSIENYIIDKEHLKNGTFLIKKPKLQDLNNNIIFDISKNFNKKENVEYINPINQSSIKTTIHVEQTLSTKQENIIENKTDHIEDYNCSLFEWSDWNYDTNEMKTINEINEIKKKQTSISKLNENDKTIEKYYKVFDFLPQKLNNIAQFKSIKLIKTPSFDNIDTKIPFNELTINYQENRKQHKDIDIHPCAFTKHLCEFKLQRTALEFTKILNQVNNQLIAALMIYDNVELLLMMDQHAVHERIRYENLLNDYKTSDHESFLSKKLPIPIIIEVNIHMCTLLISNKKLLDKYGIKLTAINKNTLNICNIPKCFTTNKQYYNDVKLTNAIRNLLNEIADNITNGNSINILPLSIHNAVSMEACRGAIKFGQSLSVEECIELFNDLKTTKSPTRCAHGRPSIIPIIELSELRKRCYKNTKVRLLFLF
ncbi:hypothetical protein M0802_011108 [Mischocyttarus mexicanus]|nr:hypothetical protein M0802_011108 [Mischocyttarus mexicanus]